LLKFQKSVRSVCGKVNRARNELIDLLSAPEPDIVAIHRKQEEIIAGQRSMQELVIEFLLSEKKVLTPEQQRNLFDMLRHRATCAGHGQIMGSIDAETYHCNTGMMSANNSQCKGGGLNNDLNIK
jgi:Spy/CpxP family protein refolding chaperone